MNCRTCKRVLTSSVHVNCDNCRNKKRLKAYIDSRWDVMMIDDNKTLIQLFLDSDDEAYIRSQWTMETRPSEMDRRMRKYLTDKHGGRLYPGYFGQESDPALEFEQLRPS